MHEINRLTITKTSTTDDKAVNAIKNPDFFMAHLLKIGLP